MGRKGWGDGKSAIQQAFIECQVRAEHMVSSNRCCEGDKKEMEYTLCPQDEGDRNISTVSLVLDLDILTCFPKMLGMKSSNQQPGACGTLSWQKCVRVCVCVCVHGYIGMRLGKGKRERGKRERVYRYSWWDWGWRKSHALYGRPFPVFSQSTSDPRWLPLVFWDPVNKLPCSLFTAMHVFPLPSLILGIRAFSVFLDLFWSISRSTRLALLSVHSLPSTSMVLNCWRPSGLPEEHLCDPGGLSPGASTTGGLLPAHRGPLPLGTPPGSGDMETTTRYYWAPLKSVQCSEESGWGLDWNPACPMNYLITPYWASVSPSVKWKFFHVRIDKCINAL